MPGCMYDLHGGIANFEYLSVVGNNGFVTGFGGRTKNDLCAGLFNKVEMTAHKIGVKMGFKYVFDLRLVFFGPVNIGLYLTQGVEDGSFTIALHIISGMCQATCIDLFNFHDGIICCDDVMI